MADKRIAIIVTVDESVEPPQASRYHLAEFFQGLEDGQIQAKEITVETPYVLDRLATFLHARPRELMVMSYQPPRPPHQQHDDGEYFMSCEFGEEVPQATADARREAIKTVLAQIGGWVLDDETCDAVIDVLDEVNTNVFAGGAIYGADPTLEATIDHALKEARC